MAIQKNIGKNTIGDNNKIALNVAEGIQQINPEATKIIAVIESWKLYPKENEKTEKK